MIFVFELVGTIICVFCLVVFILWKFAGGNPPKGKRNE